MYHLQVPASLVQNNQAIAPLGVSIGAQPVGLPTRAADAYAAPGGGNTRNLAKAEIHVARQVSHPGLDDVPVKREQHGGEYRNSKNLKKHPREAEAITKNGNYLKVYLYICCKQKVLCALFCETWIC